MTISLLSIRSLAVLATLTTMSLTTFAQQVPEIGYVFPSGAKAGSTVEVVLGGYDWTPDVELFVREPRINLRLTGTPGPVIVPEPPYWFEKKARRGPFLLPRETPATLSIPSDVPPGIYRWQVANANGVSKHGSFVVSAVNSVEIVEDRNRRDAQTLPSLPVIVSGQILKIKEVDRYRFTAERTGPLTCSTIAAKIGSELNAVLEVRDSSGRLVSDGADTEGRDLDVTFPAKAGEQYTLSVYDADFRGNRAFVYRLSITPGPRVLAAIPATLQHGETRSVTLVGHGLATGNTNIETVTRTVTALSDVAQTSFSWLFESDFGPAVPVRFSLSKTPVQSEPELVAVSRTGDAADSALAMTVPQVVTGVLSERFGVDAFQVTGQKGDVWSIDLQSEAIGSSLDVSLVITDDTGRELKRVDDLPGTTDCGLEFTVPADGKYRLLVSDTSGRSGTPDATYCLSVLTTEPGYTLSIPELLSLPIGGTAQLALKAVRLRGFTGAIRLRLDGLPEGVSVPKELVIPEKKNDLKITLTAAADCGTAAAFVTVSGEADLDARQVKAETEPALLAVTMKPPFAIDAEGKDDVTKWPRGSTFPGPVLIERDKTFNGDIVLEMTSRQGRHRQGITGPELLVQPGVERILYPIFLPEWLETTRTSRMVVNGVAQVADPKGRVRYLSTKQKTRMGFLPTGALMKISCPLPELEVRAGEAFEFPLELFRARELTEDVRLEVRLDDKLQGRFQAAGRTMSDNETSAIVRISPIEHPAPVIGEHRIKILATAMQKDKYPVVSETELLVIFLTPQ